MQNHSSSRDGEGYAPLGEYAVIGNGRSIALIAADGSIDWWAAPRLDSTPAITAVLDPRRGGGFSLRPVEQPVEVSRRYLPHSNVFETTFRTHSGSVRVTDSINSGNAGALPWTELARRVEGVDGQVELAVKIAPGTGLGVWEPWACDDGRGPVLHAGPLTMGVRCSSSVTLKTDRAAVRATTRVHADERVMVAVVATESEPLFLADVASIDQRIDLTIRDWRHWSTQVSWTGPGRERIVRSALALKLLLMADTGAIAAAATTSLPERVGGTKNWDYRYAWIRDMALTIDAMSACGLEEETHAAVAWLLRTIRRNGPELSVMYTLDGQVPGRSREADVPGYRDSRPVLVGNDAVAQTQLGVYGDLFGTVSSWVEAGHVLDIATARQLTDLADRCCDLWTRDDAGLWELGETRPYTSSKMNCWRALDRAARLADDGHIDGPAGRWRREAEAIREWVDEHCWSEVKNAYTFFAGSDELDASVLLGARFGFDRGRRMSATVDAVVAELGAGPLIYRYSGAEEEEQAFVACSFWVAEAQAYVGRVEESAALLGRLDAVAGPSGLFTEMMTPVDGEAVGNLPQALSHLAHINATFALATAVRGES